MSHTSRRWYAETAGLLSFSVPTRHVVVLVGEGPVDELRPAAGDGDRHRSPRPEDAGQLGHGRLVLGNVLEDLGGDHPVEGTVGEGESEGCLLYTSDAADEEDSVD